jgi:hypothetical protein
MEFQEWLAQAKLYEARQAHRWAKKTNAHAVFALVTIQL